MSLTITNKSIDGVEVVQLNGAVLFGEDSNMLRTQVRALLEQCKKVVLDMRAVPRIDSSGLGTLIALYASAKRCGTEIKLANLGIHPREVLQITRLVTVFEVFDSTDAAVASFKTAKAAP
ncbi:MAG TPA: STAS domain-containing protein [Candidatus Acidoferrales bacterium]|nr:STAS domain-containing protein [Candidatus Acidoferrales bacterium]